MVCFCILCLCVDELCCKLLFFSLGRVSVKHSVFSNVLSASHRAARPIELLVSIQTEFHCDRADVKPKRWRSAAQISVI